MTQIFNRSSDTQKSRRLRRESPLTEQRLWLRLRNRQLMGYRFRRQYGVGPYVLDFYCPELKLAIEVDGDSRFEAGAGEYDRERQRYIESLGSQVLRFTNREVLERLDDVAGGIAAFVEGRRGGTPSKSPPS
ncbi:MAG: endonuclease domain-containing protein [Gammaproteobacteria bacterium]